MLAARKGSDRQSILSDHQSILTEEKAKQLAGITHTGLQPGCGKPSRHAACVQRWDLA